MTGKVTWKATKFVGQTTVRSAKIIRKADRALTSRTVTNAVYAGKEYTKQQIRNSGDAGQAAATAGSAAMELFRSTHRLMQQRRIYYGKRQFNWKKLRFTRTPGAKKEYHYQKLYYKRITQKRKSVLKTGKYTHKEFTQKQRATLNRLKTRAPKSMIRAQKKFLKAEKKGYKDFRKATKKANKAEKKLLKQRKRLKKMSKPKLDTGGMVLRSAKQELRNAAMQDGADNEFIQGAEKLRSIQKAVTPQKSGLQKQRQRAKKLQKQSGKREVKLHNRESKLMHKQKRKKNIPANKKKRRPGGHGTVGGWIASGLRSGGQAIKGLAGKVFVAVAPFVLLAGLLYVFVLPLLFVDSVGGRSSFVMGTYSALDSDLSEAAEYYTKLAYKANEAIIKCGTADWKDGLRYFGVSNSTLRSYRDDPDTFTFTDSGYDFDYWKFYSFLCAYYYEFDEDEQAIPYWEYGGKVEQTIDQLFNREYSFEYEYQNGSHWRKRNQYDFRQGKDTFSRAYPSIRFNDIAEWGVFEFDFKPSGLEEYAVEADGRYRVYYDLESLEILNANDDKSKTGWYFLNQCSTIEDPSGEKRVGFYYKNRSGNYGGDYGIYVDCGDDQFWFPRTGIYSDTDMPAVVSPRDAVLWLYSFSSATDPDTGTRISTFYNDLIHAYTKFIPSPNKRQWNRNGFYNSILEKAEAWDSYSGFGYCSWYKKYDWVKECRLTYTMKQKMSFDEAIKSLLNEKDPDGTLYEYYLLLIGEGDDSGIVYGNHQTLVSPLSSGLVNLEKNKFFINGYGWDMQGWNRKHCELTMHNGVDIIQNSGSPVYAMFDGEITDAKDGHLTLTTNGNKANLWYDDEHHLKVTYSNVSPIVNNNDNVKAGDIIGYSTRERRCYTMNNASTGCDYVHISLSVEYASGLLSLSTEWKTVDPRLLIGLDNN